MKQAVNQQSGTANSREISVKPSGGSLGTPQKSLSGDGKNLGTGTQYSRTISTKPGGSSGLKGSAQPKDSAPVFKPENASVLGTSVYKVSKPAKG